MVTFIPFLRSTYTTKIYLKRVDGWSCSSAAEGLGLWLNNNFNNSLRKKKKKKKEKKQSIRQFSFSFFFFSFAPIDLEKKIDKKIALLK